MLAAQTPTHVAGFSIPIVVVAGNRLLLEALPDNRGPLQGIVIVGRSLDGADLQELLQRAAPKLLLLDGASFCKTIHTLGDELSIRLGQTRRAVFADGFSDAQFELALSSGVHGLLSQQDSLSDLGAAVRAIAQGERRVSNHFRDRIDAGPRAEWRVQRRCRLKLFSDRQLEVLMHLAEGKRVKDIADALHVSEKAIESHKYRLMNRLGIHDRVELCRWAIREGLIEA